MEHHAVHVSPLHCLTAQNIFRQIMSPGKKTKFGVSPQHRRCVLCFGVPLLISSRKLRYTRQDYTDIKKTIHRAREEWDNFGKTPVTILFVCLFPTKVSQVSQVRGPSNLLLLDDLINQQGSGSKWRSLLIRPLEWFNYRCAMIKAWKGIFQWSSLNHPETSSVFGLGVS